VIYKNNNMKTTSKVLALVAMLTAVSQATTTITGTTGSAFKDQGGVTNIPSGSLVLLVADGTGNGFLANSLPGAITPGVTGLSGNTITTDQAGLTVGSLFGGDTVIATTTAGSSGSIGGFAAFDVTNALSKNFAVVWFTQAAGSIGAGSYFGILRLSDWTMPSDADGKAYGLSSTDANGATGFYSVSATISAAQIGATGFFTGTGTGGDASADIKAATFQIVPEPSAALLGAIGALGLLRRRRN
jgi:hypothetical protein